MSTLVDKFESIYNGIITVAYGAGSINTNNGSIPITIVNTPQTLTVTKSSGNWPATPAYMYINYPDRLVEVTAGSNCFLGIYSGGQQVITPTANVGFFTLTLRSLVQDIPGDPNATVTVGDEGAGGD